SAERDVAGARHVELRQRVAGGEVEKVDAPAGQRRDRDDLPGRIDLHRGVGRGRSTQLPHFVRLSVRLEGDDGERWLVGVDEQQTIRTGEEAEVDSWADYERSGVIDEVPGHHRVAIRCVAHRREPTAVGAVRDDLV